MNQLKHRPTYWTIFVLAAATLVSSTASAQDTNLVCGEEIKAEIAKALDTPIVQKDPTSKEAISYEAAVYAKYEFCLKDAQDIKSLPIVASSAYCGTLAYLGNTTFEKMRCCGYDPQKRLFGCPVEVLLPYGFGGAPYPGSYENVLTCVDFGAGYVPVARDRVHLANAVTKAPVWNFAVIAKATGKLAEASLSGQTLWARSILSWGFTPSSCTFRPYWGNVLDYKIRLDP